MISALILSLQSVQMLAPAIDEARLATNWQCRFTDASGERFMLKGRFPEAPVGHKPNDGVNAVIEGNAPEYLLGSAVVKVFEQTEETRQYFFSKRRSDGVRHNFSFLLTDGGGSANSTVFRPDPSTGRGTLSAYAVGRCNAQFNLEKSEGSAQ